MRLILVRHGQTPSNIGRLLDTDEPGADLSDLGRAQAEALPRALGREPIEAIYASTLVRTQQTADPLARVLGLPVEVRAGLREFSAGALEMLGDDESVIRYLTTVFAWSNGDLDLRMPGGESGHEAYGRVDEVVAEVAGSGVGTAVLVAHGALIRSWCASRVENVTVEHAERHAVSNTGAVVLDGAPDAGWWALTWEDHALGGRDVDGTEADGPAGQPYVEPGR